MTEDAKKARRAYQNAWRKAHPDHVRKAQERYWERRAAELNNSERKEGDNDANAENAHD